MTGVTAYISFLDEVDDYAPEMRHDELKSLVVAAREALQLDLALRRDTELFGEYLARRLSLTLFPTDSER